MPPLTASPRLEARPIGRLSRRGPRAPDVSCEDVARRLDAFNRRRFVPGVEASGAASAAAESLAIALELAFVDGEIERVREAAAEAPTDADAFVAWFEALKENGPGQGDLLFDWLATSAPLDAMRWFLRQEVAGEAGFDDLVALTQVKMPRRAKLELARNYWDEMGQGQPSAMHGPMLANLADELGLDAGAGGSGGVVWESLALANAMVGMAVHRQHAFRSLGALGVIELTAPGRAAKVNEGLRRLGFGGEARRYYALHATLDVKHSEAWNREILAPLVASDPNVARPVAEGALVRLTAGERCYRRYRRSLGVLG